MIRWKINHISYFLCTDFCQFIIILDVRWCILLIFHLNMLLFLKGTGNGRVPSMEYTLRVNMVPNRLRFYVLGTLWGLHTSVEINFIVTIFTIRYELTDFTWKSWRRVWLPNCMPMLYIHASKSWQFDTQKQDPVEIVQLASVPNCAKSKQNFQNRMFLVSLPVPRSYSPA